MSTGCGKEKDPIDLKSSIQVNPKSSQNNQNHSGDPVNLVTGAFTLDEQDVSFPVQRLMITLNRHYDSLQHNQAKSPGPFGWGWTHTFNLYLIRRVNKSGVEIDYIDDRGALVTFKQESSAAKFTPPPGALGMELNGSPQQGYFLRQVDGLLAEFNGYGKITALIRPGPKADSRLEFSYDTQDRLSGVLGPGGKKLLFHYTESDSLISAIVDHAGREWQYKYDRHRNLVQVRNPGGILRCYAYGYKKVKVAQYQESHNTTELIDRPIKGLYQAFFPVPEGKSSELVPQVTNQYTSEFRVFQQIDAAGGITRFDYNRFTRTTGLTDPAGWTTLYCYDKQGNTTKIRRPEGGITEYIYDTHRNLVAEIDPLGQRTLYVELKNPRWLDQQIEFGQRAFGNRSDYITVPDEEIAIGYDENGNRPLKRDASGNTYYYLDYNRFGQPQQIILPTGGQIRFVYDQSCGLPLRVEQILERGYLEPQLWIQTFEYDHWGNLIAQEEWTVTDNGAESPHRMFQQEFDELGLHPVKRYKWIKNSGQLDGKEQIRDEEELVWDELGRLKSLRVIRRSALNGPEEILETQWAYNVLNQVLWRLDPDGTAHCFVYDIHGRPIETFLIEKATTDTLSACPVSLRKMRQQWSYDLLGCLVRFTDATGVTTDREYDERSLCTHLIEATGFITKFEYDRDGRETRRTTSLGYEVRSFYDKAGHLIRQADNFGLDKMWSYDALERVTIETENVGELSTSKKYFYDYSDQIKEIHFADDSNERMEYDERGLLTRRERGHEPIVVEVYRYDGLGRLTEVLAGDRAEQRTLFLYRYDDSRRCVEIIDGIGNLTRNYFDTTNCLTRSEDAEGQKLDLIYDPMGRLQQKESQNHDVSSSFIYDYAGHLVSCSESGIINEWEYDAAGRMTQHHQQINQNAWMVRYFYDQAGRLIAKDIGSNWSVKYEYKDNSPFISQIIFPGQKLTVESDNQGRVVEEHWQSGSRASYKYLPNGSVMEKENYDDHGTLVSNQRFHHDSRLRWDREERILGPNRVNYKYTFDHLDQLKQVDLITDEGSFEFRRYEYDALGNRMSEYRQGKLWKVWHYDSANRITEEEDSEGHITTFKYDHRGNLVQRGLQKFLYDSSNRLHLVINAGSDVPLLEFVYSATDQRVLIHKNGSSEQCVFDGLHKAISISPAGEQSIYWGFQADQILAASKGASQKPFPIMTDALNSVISYPDNHALQDYDPYGNPSRNDFPFGFCGKPYYSDINLYDNKARFYDPCTGRFTQADPSGSSDGHNLYLFAKNNPLVYIDQLGLKSQQSAQGRIAAPSGNYYSVLFEVQLSENLWGVNRYTHFKAANEAFIQALTKDPAYYRAVSQFIPEPIEQARKAGGRTAPEGWVWHHQASREGVMQLVPDPQHTVGSIFWATMHPGNKGGYSNWAIPAGAPPNK